MPKGVMLTHRNLVSNMQMLEKTTGTTVWKLATGELSNFKYSQIPSSHNFKGNYLNFLYSNFPGSGATDSAVLPHFRNEWNYATASCQGSTTDHSA